jgi:spermidine synthase
MVVMLPATILMGIVFPFGMHLLAGDAARSGRRIGLAYLANTLGCMAGSLGAGYLLLPALGLKAALVAVALAQAAMGLALLPWTGRAARVLAPASVAVLTIALLAGPGRLPGPVPFDLGVNHPGGPRVLAHEDATAASATVVETQAGQRLLRIDGFVATSDTGSAGYMATLAHLPMLVHPAPRDVLVICFGTGTTAGSTLLHEDTRVDVVDLNPAVFRFAGLFSHVNHGVAESPRARRIVDDGRHYLQTTPATYDVVTSEPMPPAFAGVVSLYSREYYELAYSRLKPGGVLAQWLPFHLVGVNEGLAILKTVQSVFPNTTLWVHEGTGIVVARRDGPVALDVPRVQQALRGALAQDLDARGLGGLEGLAEAYLLGPDAIRSLTRTTAVITDDRPSLEFQAAHWAWIKPAVDPRQDPHIVLAALLLGAARAETPLLQHADAALEAEIVRRHRSRLAVRLSALLSLVGMKEEAAGAAAWGLSTGVTGPRRAELEQLLAEARP